MIRNYFLVAFRSLLRNKAYTAINVAGLSIGIAACLLVFLVLRYESSFDQFHSKKDRVYRVVSSIKTPDGVSYSAGAPYPVPKTLRTDFPQLEKVAAIYGSGDDVLAVTNAEGRALQKFKEKDGVFFTEPDFFEIFDFKWISGNPKMLGEPNVVALTRETATRYFGSWQAAIGQQLVLNREVPLKVVGILEDVPVNTDFPLKAVASLSTHPDATRDDWVSVSSMACCFVLLRPDYPASRFEAALPAFYKKYKPADEHRNDLGLQPLATIHTDERYGNFTQRTTSNEFITAIGLIGLFLLIIACVNFINLATAQAVNRSREVGVRKVLGGTRRQLLLQFLGETALVTMVSVLLAVLLAILLLPSLNTLLEMKIPLGADDLPVIALFLVLLSGVVVFFSGFYPAVILSGFNPVMALKGKLRGRGKKGISLRRGLVIFQFTVAQVLVICMLVVVKQMDFFRNAQLGFRKEAVLTVPIPVDSVTYPQLEPFRNRLAQEPGIESVSLSFASPTDYSNWFSDFTYDHNKPLSNFDANLKWADADYFNLYQLKFVAGGPYPASDTIRGFVVNELFLQKLGVQHPEEAIGKNISMWDGRFSAPITGVVKDFHAQSMRDPIEPVLMASQKQFYSVASIRFRPGNMQQRLAAVEYTWSTFFPAGVFEYQFLDEKIDSYYKSEARLSLLYKLFAGISIFISCLGVYGLVSFMAVQRVKEVGIRKVLGATAGSILYLFSREFVLLTGIAFVVAAPLAYFLMHRWLEDFTYRIAISWWIFLLAGLSAVFIALLTVSFKAVRAALANPVKSIRTE